MCKVLLIICTWGCCNCYLTYSKRPGTFPMNTPPDVMTLHPLRASNVAASTICSSLKPAHSVCMYDCSDTNNWSREIDCKLSYVASYLQIKKNACNPAWNSVVCKGIISPGSRLYYWLWGIMYRLYIQWYNVCTYVLLYARIRDFGCASCLSRRSKPHNFEKNVENLNSTMHLRRAKIYEIDHDTYSIELHRLSTLWTWSVTVNTDSAAVIWFEINRTLLHTFSTMLK